jgi:diacylglycerol kinase
MLTVGVGARFRSFRFALSGLRVVASSEPNMQIHCVAAICAVSLGFWCRIGADEWRWIVICIAQVMAAEAVNTSIEQACNAVGLLPNEHIRVAKDVAAGAVLLTAIGSALIGLTVFLPYLL